MRSDIRLSVVVPLYQKAAHIERCLDSVLASLRLSANPFEIIIVDDGSTDGSDRIALRWLRANLPRGSWKFHSGPNGGAAAARNTGWNMARNEIVMFIDADDEWQAGHVFTMTSLIYEFPTACLYGTGWNVVTNQGGLQDMTFGTGAGGRGILPSFFLAMATGPMVITSSSSATWRSCLKETGGFPVGVTHGEDKAGWARLAALGAVAFDPTVTATWRKDTENRSDIGVTEPSSAFLRAVEEAIDRASRKGAVTDDMEACADVEAARLAGIISLYDPETPSRIAALTGDARHLIDAQRWRRTS